MDSTKSSLLQEKHNHIWFKPPYSTNVQTNFSKTFLNLIKKHFPPNHNLHTVFNTGHNVKVSYSFMPNMGSIANNHNQKILNNKTTSQNGCNCRKKDQFLLDNNYLITSVIYEANVTIDKDNTGKNYFGLTEGTFKQRYTQHTLSWSITSSASTYNNKKSTRLIFY